jgi:hypothetical protein
MFIRTMLQLLVTSNIVRRSQILSTVMMEATPSYETSVVRRAIRRRIPEDGILLDLYGITVTVLP